MKLQNTARLFGGLLFFVSGCASQSVPAQAQNPPVTPNLGAPTLADAGFVNVKTQYGAKGDGQTDDTKAIQAALDDHPAAKKIIFLPAGTYRISDTLRWPAGTLDANGKAARGTEFKRLALQGEGVGKTTIRLQDGTFTDAQKPKALIYTGPKPAQRFDNRLHDLTLDTGQRNPGAIGLQFNASNAGAVTDVEIRSGDGSGPIGLDLSFTDEIGPQLIKDVTIFGFDVGVKTDYAVNSSTFENLSIQNPRVVGFQNQGQVVNLRHYKFSGSVPALTNNLGFGGRASGFVTLLSSTLTGTGDAAKIAAIDNRAYLFLRDVSAPGFARAVDSSFKTLPNSDPQTTLERITNETAKNTVAAPQNSTITEWVSHAPLSLFASPARSLNLPIKETPKFEPDLDPQKWATPFQFGLDPKQQNRADTAPFIQKAIDSGKPTILLPSNPANGKTAQPAQAYFFLASPITIKPSVTHFTGGAWLRARTEEIEIRVEGDGPPLLIDRMEVPHGVKITVVQNSNRAVVLRHLIGVGVRVVRGELFIENVTTNQVFVHKDGQLWARQLNPEPEGTHIQNDGGKVWILGLKTEVHGTLIETLNGGQTEVLGAHMYSTGAIKDMPMFVVKNAQMTLAGREFNGNGKPYVLLLEETRGGQTKKLWRGDVPWTTGNTFPFLSAWSGDGTQTKPIVRTEAPPELPAPPPPPAPETPGTPLAKVALPAVKIIEDFESLTPDARRALPLDKQNGWTGDLPRNILFFANPSDAGNPSKVAAQVISSGNSTDPRNYAVAEKLFPNPGFSDSDTIVLSYFARAIPGSYGLPGWESFAGPRVPRAENQPLTRLFGVNPVGSGPLFGLARPRDRDSTLTALQLLPAEGFGRPALLSEQKVPLNHWIELRLVITQNADPAKSTGSLYWRDATAGDTQFSLSSLKDVPLKLSTKNKPSLWGAWVWQGKGSGYYDNFGWGKMP